MVCSLLLLVSSILFGIFCLILWKKSGGIKAIKFLRILQVKVETFDQWNDGCAHSAWPVAQHSSKLLLSEVQCCPCSCWWWGALRVQERLEEIAWTGKMEHMWEANPWRTKALIVLLFIELFLLFSIVTMASSILFVCQRGTATVSAQCQHQDLVIFAQISDTYTHMQICIHTCSPVTAEQLHCS